MAPFCCYCCCFQVSDCSICGGVNPCEVHVALPHRIFAEMGIGLGFRCTDALRDRDTSGLWPRAPALKRIARMRQQVPRLMHSLDVLLPPLRTTTNDGDQAKGKPRRPLPAAASVSGVVSSRAKSEEKTSAL